MKRKAPTSQIVTGDMLVCQGRGIVSGVISGWTMMRSAVSGWGQPWVSHTACVVDQPFPGIHAAHAGLIVYESTTLNHLPDLVDGQYRQGVQAHAYETWLAAYPGRVWHVPLMVSIDASEYIGYLEWKHNCQIGYDKRGAIASATWFGRLMGWHRPKQRIIEDTETDAPIYCTALYLYGLRRGGVLPANIEPRHEYPRSVLRLPIFGEPRLVKPSE